MRGACVLALAAIASVLAACTTAPSAPSASAPPLCRPGPAVPDDLTVDPGDAACRAWMSGTIDAATYAAAVRDRLDVLLVAHAERALGAIGRPTEAGRIRALLRDPRRGRGVPAAPPGPVDP